MGRVKEFYHDEILAQQEERDAAMEQMILESDINAVAEVCANDPAMYEFFLKRMHHYMPNVSH